jgi:hypothetical protein
VEGPKFPEGLKKQTLYLSKEIGEIFEKKLKTELLMKFVGSYYASRKISCEVMPEN